MTDDPWVCTGNPPGSHEELENYGDSCLVCRRSRPEPNGTSPNGNGKGTGTKVLPIIGVIAVIAALAGGGYFYLNSRRPIIPTPISTWVTPTISPSTISTPIISSGDRVLFTAKANPDGEKGIAAFKQGNYPQAVQEFNKAIQGDRNSPEWQIYLQNAKARQAGKSLTLAVVVPIYSGGSSAEEMLRGVADAQTKFNDVGGLNGRLVEILIANDGNDPATATQIAQELINNAQVLGVIGHNASDASKAGLAEYEKAGLAMISPTSTSTELQGKVFFRTVPSDAISGQKLADYTKNKLNIDQVAVFYNPNSSYSKSIQQAFVNQFQQQGGQVVKTIDLTNPSFDAVTELTGLQNQVKAIALFPNTKYVPGAIAVAVANDTFANFKLLGGDALYTPVTLTSGANAVQGLTLVVPWVAQTPYAQTAEKRWLGQINWRTAMSFDATQALIKALSSNPTRRTVLDSLKAVNLSGGDTSGNPLQFDAHGDRQTEPFIVEVQRGSGGPQGSSLIFKLLN